MAEDKPDLLNIEDAMKRSKQLGKEKKRQKKASDYSTNENIDKIRELGREISELKRKKSMATTPEEQQKIQDRIDKKQEAFDKLKEKGRPRKK